MHTPGCSESDGHNAKVRMCMYILCVRSDSHTAYAPDACTQRRLDALDKLLNTLQRGDSPVPKRQRLLTDSTGKDETADVCTSLQINDETAGPSAPATSQSDMPSSNAATIQHTRATLSPMVDEARVLS